MKKKIKTEEEILKAKEIANERAKKWYEKNKEKAKLTRQEYYENNKDKKKTNDIKYRENNKEKIKKSNTKYRKNNKEKVKELEKNRVKKYRENNKEKIKESTKLYRENNKEKIKNAMTKWRIENPDYIKNRKNIDSLFKLKCSIKTIIYKSLHYNNYYKKSKTNDILGCSYEEFRAYVESLWKSWMNWDNYGNPKDGIYELNKTWDIDHIIPLSSATTEEELLKLNHFSNLQPLCSYINRFIKKDDTRIF